MAVAPTPPRLAPHVGQLLARLRSRIRQYITWLGGSRLLILLGIAFWVLLGVDYLFEPLKAVRVTGLVLVALLACYVVVNDLLIPLWRPLADRSLALLLERRYSQLAESLLTAIEIERGEAQAVENDELGAEMLRHTFEVASRETDGLPLGALFNSRPLRMSLFLASLLIGSIVALGVLAPGVFSLGVKRIFAATNEPWPRATHLSIDGFENGEAVVAKGGELRVVARAALDGVVPETVQIRYHMADGHRDRKLMIREGNAKADTDASQPFVHLFQGILSPIEFDIRGGDARLKGLRVRVVDSPAITSVLHCEYPPYLERAPREIAVTSAVPLPRGTKVTLQATANKPLVRAVVDYQLPDGSNRSADLKPHGDSGELAKRFDFTLDRLDDDVTLQFTLLDADKIQNRDPIRVTLLAVPDTAPHVSVQLAGIGAAITPQARVPFTGSLTDDYAIERAWIEYSINDGGEQQKPFAAKLARPTSLEIAEVLEAPPLKLEPGQKLRLSIRAADAHHAPDQPAPNIGQGDAFLLDVVTPATLRTMLEARELNLRQRLETIIREVTEQREALTRLDDAVDKPMDETPPSEQVSPATKVAAALERLRLRIERARQNSPKNAEETLGVARGFDEIQAELVNNRIDTEELQTRLQRQIAEPLRAIGEKRFPVLDQHLTGLAGLAATAGADRDGAHRQVLAQYDVILVELEQVKAKMLELETFNEALDLLRSIIAEQKALAEETKKQNKGSVLKDL